MARFATFLTGIAFAALLAGCLNTPMVPDAAKGTLGPIDLRAGPALWNDPQDAPLPGAEFGYATLANPPNGTNVPAWWRPVNATPLPASLKGLDHVAQSPSDVRSGAGIAVFGSLAIVPGYGQPTGILDIRDPAHPKTLSTFKSQTNANHRGAVVIPYPSGRLVTVISTGTGLDIWDITDPTHPVGLTPITIKSHKVGVVPGTPIIYNAASGGGGTNGNTPETATGVTEMWDLTDPEAPVRLPDFKNGFSCHHVYFWNDPAHAKYRGICAGKPFAQLWDTTNPRDPKVIVSVPIFQGKAGTPSPSGGTLPWAHYAGLSANGKILLVGDENGGGSSPPGCVASVNTPQGAVSTPIGALWFYDVSNEKDPKLLGWYSPLNDPTIKNTPTQSCTAHHGRMVPVPNKDIVAMSWYGDGVIVVDYTNIDFTKGILPKVVDQFADQSDTWETWYDQGYLFTGDLARGLDVLKFK